MDTTMKVYQAIDVWTRASGDRLVRYRCFKNVQTDKYSVQSSDFYQLPLDANRASYLENQFLTLLAEAAPDERATGFDTLSEAIRAHDQTFGAS
jgi:hypothetical protein